MLVVPLVTILMTVSAIAIVGVTAISSPPASARDHEAK
jgi:hypothetical protein